MISFLIYIISAAMIFAGMVGMALLLLEASNSMSATEDENSWVCRLERTWGRLSSGWRVSIAAVAISLIATFFIVAGYRLWHYSDKMLSSMWL